MSLESVLTTDFAKAFILALVISFILTCYVIRKKKIKWKNNLMDGFVAWTITTSICITIIFAVVPAFFYLLCGNWVNTPWAVLVDIATDGLIKQKF